MANGQRFISELAPITGNHRALLQMRMGELRKEGLIPLRVDLDHNHAALVTLVLACSQTNTIADLRRLFELTWRDPEAGDLGSLGHVLAATIGIRAHRIHNGQEPIGQFDARDMRLEVCLDPLQAAMIWTRDGIEQRREFAVPESPPTAGRGLRRVTIIDATVLNCVARLCADTLARTMQKRNRHLLTQVAAVSGTGELADTNAEHPAGKDFLSSGGSSIEDIGLGQGATAHGSGNYHPRIRSVYGDRITDVAAAAGD